MAYRLIGNKFVSDNSPELQMYNTLGRDVGASANTGPNNFVQKRLNSIDNAIGTTGAALYETGGNLLPATIAGITGGEYTSHRSKLQNEKTESLLKDNQTKLNDIAKKYGYADFNSVWDARDAAEAAGDTAKVAEIDNTVVPELKTQASANVDTMRQNSAEYNDYVQNNDVSKRINQDSGKFLGSAMNTLSTGFDVLSMAAGIPNGALINAGQGAFEGIADELEQNGLKNFDWGKAGLNAATGAAAGAATGTLNTRIGNRMAANNSKLFDVDNILGKTANKIAQTGLGRGALSGAVGGAVGGATGSVLTGQDLGTGVANTLSGAGQGALQGAVMGGAMSAANRIGNYALNTFSPELAQRIQNNAQAWDNWKNSGDTFNERLTNTLTSGDSVVGDWLMNKRQSRVLGAAGGLGNRIQDVSDTYRTVDSLGNRKEYTPDQVRQLINEYENYKAPDVLSSNSTDEVIDAMGEAGVTLSEIFRNRNGGQFDPYSRADGEAFNKWVQQTKADLGTPTTAKGWLKKAGQRIVEDINNSNLGNRIKNVDEERIPLDESMRRINNVRGGEAESETIGKLPLEYMYGETENPNIEYISRIANEKIMAGDAKNLSVAELAYSTNNYNRAKIIEFDKNGTGRLNIVRPIGNGKTAVIALEKQPDGNTLITTIRPNASSNYVRNLTKNKGANVLYDTTGEAATAFTAGAPAASRAIAGDINRIIPQTEQNVNDFDYVFEDARGNRARLPELRKTLSPDNNTVIANSDLIDSPIRGRMYDNMPNSEFIKYAEQNGWKLASTPYEGMSGSEMLNTMAKNAGFEDYNAATRNFTNSGEATKGTDIVDWMENRAKVNTPETEVYRTLMGETKQPEIQAEPGKTSKEYTYRQKRNEKLLDQYGTIDKPTAKAVRAVETVGQIADAGFEKPVEVEAVIRKITGSDGTLNKLNRKVIANATDVNTMDGVDPGTSLSDFIDQQIRLNGLYGTSDGNALTTEIEAVMNKLPSRRNGTITGLDNPEDVFDVIQTLEKHSANYKGKSGSNYGTSNPYKEQKAAVLDSLSTMLKDRIYEASDVSKVVTSDVIDDMKSWYPDNEKWAKWVDENVATAKSGADLRAAQAPFVRMGKIIDNAVVNSGTFGSKMPRYALKMATSNPLGVLVNGAEILGETSIGKRLAAKAYDKLANREAAKASATTTTPTPSTPTPTQTTATTTPTPQATTTTTPTLSTQIYNAIGRETGLQEGERAAGNYISEAAQETGPVTLENMASTPSATSATSVYNSLNGNTTTSGNYYSDLLQRAMQMALADGNANAYASLLSMYNEYAKDNTATEASQTKLTDKQRQANAAARALDDMVNAENNFAYDISDIPIIGGLANMTGNDYKAKAEALALQVGYMLSGATVNAQEAKNIGMAYVPQPRESEAERKRKLAQLRGIISDYQQTYAE